MPISTTNILWQDENYIAVNKPTGLPVHQNKFLAKDADYLTKAVGQLLDQSIYNVHRLDAKTSGVVLLAKSSKAAHAITVLFEQREIEKVYLAIVKGNPGQGQFDRDVLNSKKRGKRVTATTLFETIQTTHTKISYKEFTDIDLSLVQLKPHTGRWHQLRQHCSQQRYDIIGDVQHGDRKLSRIIKEITGHHRLFLHATSLRFTHPFTSETIEVNSELPPEFKELMNNNLLFYSA